MPASSDSIQGSAMSRFTVCSVTRGAGNVLAGRPDKKVQRVAVPALLDALEQAAVLALKLRRLFADAALGLRAAELMGDADGKIRHESLVENTCSVTRDAGMHPSFHSINRG